MMKDVQVMSSNVLMMPNAFQHHGDVMMKSIALTHQMKNIAKVA